jgi:hypothetical protein
LLCVLVLGLHAHTLRAYFLGDDFDILQLVVQQDGFVDALDMTFAGNWGPMSYLQFYLNYVIGGSDPLIYHLTNLFWLCLTVLALYAFVRTVWPESAIAAWSAALLFAVHPVHDEAVTYICARSHTVAASLGLLSLLLYARARLVVSDSRRQVLWIGGAVLAAFLAALSKESAFTVVVWIAAFEWLFVHRPGQRLTGRLLRSAGSLALFFLAPAGVAVARRLVIGGKPPKLDAAEGGLGEALGQFGGDLPVYVLYGGLPIPFNWINPDALGAWRWLAWLLVVAAVLLGLWLFYRDAVSDTDGRGAGLYVLGLVIAAATLFPVLYVDLPLRRRYLFISSIGIVLMVAPVFAWLQARHRRAAQGLLALVVLAGAAGLVQRNELYRRSGEVARNIVHAVIDAPDAEHLRRIVLITLPRFYGGDSASGAYLLHHTDLRSALRLHGIDDPTISYAMVCDFADDYTADARFVDDRQLEVTVTFRRETAFELARYRDPREDARGDDARGTLVDSDAEARTLEYSILLEPDFWDDRRRALFLYSNGAFTRLRP